MRKKFDQLHSPNTQCFWRSSVSVMICTYFCTIFHLRLIYDCSVGDTTDNSLHLLLCVSLSWTVSKWRVYLQKRMNTIWKNNLCMLIFFFVAVFLMKMFLMLYRYRIFLFLIKYTEFQFSVWKALPSELIKNIKMEISVFAIELFKYWSAMHRKQALTLTPAICWEILTLASYMSHFNQLDFMHYLPGLWRYSKLIVFLPEWMKKLAKNKKVFMV